MKAIKRDIKSPLTLQESILWIATRDRETVGEADNRKVGSMDLFLSVAAWRSNNDKKGLATIDAIEALVQACRSGRVAATGLNGAGDRTEVRPMDWLDLRINTLSLHAESEHGPVKFVDYLHFDQEQLLVAFPDFTVSRQPDAKPGAKEQYDWDEGKRVAAVLFRDRGDFAKPENRTNGWRSQNDLVKLVQAALTAAGSEPSDSVTKGHVGQWLKEWRSA